MTSKIKVDNINKVSDDSNIIKKCGTTTTIGSGASNPIVVDGSAVTLGRCGGTVALASGATQTGFGRTGTVDWQTGSIKTSTFTAANGEGYFANTSGGGFTINLPAGSAGAIFSVVDYTNTFNSNSLTVSPNGSEKIGGVASDAILGTAGQSVTFVYVDATEGWKNIQDSTSNVVGNEFIVATGGTITTCGNDKIHTFTGSGTFTVAQVHPCAANNLVSYLVVAGGASGGGTNIGGGGGGAGGFRETKSPVTPYTASPLDGYSTPGNRITLTAQAYPITVGAGGASGGPGPGPGPSSVGNSGSVSTFSTVTSAGGGGGAADTCGPKNANPGGSGGGGYGASSVTAGGTGNTPPTTPSQGSDGGPAGGNPSTYANSGGGGGATATGEPITGSFPGGGPGGNGGAGATTEISGSSTGYAGGGGGSADNRSASRTGGDAGTGGGGQGGDPTRAVTSGTANTGGGGGGQHGPSNPSNVGFSGAGGSGIVIIRYKYQ